MRFSTTFYAYIKQLFFLFVKDIIIVKQVTNLYLITDGFTVFSFCLNEFDFRIKSYKAVQSDGGVQSDVG